MITAHKGLIAFELRLGFAPMPGRAGRLTRALFKGRGAHSSTPHLGHNAIKAALGAISAHPELEIAAVSGGDAINKVAASSEVLLSGDTSALRDIVMLEDHRGPLIEHRVPHTALVALGHFIAQLEHFAHRSGPPEPDYAAPTLTCNPGVVRSSDREVRLEFELRPPPSLSLDATRAGVAQVAAELEKQFLALSVSLNELRGTPGYRIPLDSEAVTTAMEAQARAGIPIAKNIKAGCTEAGVYAAAGLQPVVFGPGPSEGVIHAPNEHNLLSEVEAAVRFYSALLEL